MDTEKPGSANFEFFTAFLFAVFGLLTLPSARGDLSMGVLSFFLLFCALAGVVKAASSLIIKYRRRKARADSRAQSSTLGAARYARLSERLRAAAHNLNNPILAGLCDGLPLTIPEHLHLLVEAAPGAGKTSGLVTATIYQAVMNGYSCIVPDVKPEMAYLWGRTLEQQGFRVVYNNPAGIGDFKHTDSNPFAVLVEAAHSECGQEDVFELADAIAYPLIPNTKDDKNKFFVLNERNALIFALVALAVFEPDNLYPAKVLRTLTDPARFNEFVLLARDDEFILDGELAAIASAFKERRERNPEHYESALAGAAHALNAFRPSSRLGKIGRAHEVDPKALRDETKPPMIIFDIIPPDKIETYAKANALTQTARLQALRRHKEGRKVLFLCDEATNISVPGIVKDMELMRGFGVRVALFYQSRASLRRVYGEHEAEAILSVCAQIFFSVTNTAQAEEISKRLGQYTVKSHGHSFAERGEASTSTSEHARVLEGIDDILSLPPNKALLFLPGCRPIKFDKVPYYRVDPFKDLVGDNPNERHAKSRITEYRLVYGKNASNLGPPIMPDWRERLKMARAQERQALKQPKAPPFPHAGFRVGANLRCLGCGGILFGNAARPSG